MNHYPFVLVCTDLSFDNGVLDRWVRECIDIFPPRLAEIVSTKNIVIANTSASSRFSDENHVVSYLGRGYRPRQFSGMYTQDAIILNLGKIANTSRPTSKAKHRFQYVLMHEIGHAVFNGPRQTRALRSQYKSFCRKHFLDSSVAAQNVHYMVRGCGRYRIAGFDPHRRIYPGSTRVSGSKFHHLSSQQEYMADIFATAWSMKLSSQKGLVLRRARKSFSILHAEIIKAGKLVNGPRTRANKTVTFNSSWRYQMLPAFKLKSGMRPI